MQNPLDEVYAFVRDTDPDVLDADGLARYTGCVAELVAWCEARQVRATRRQRALADEGRAADPQSSLCRDGRQSCKDAKAAAERERVCTSMPGFEEALEHGAVSSGHVDAIANATKNLDDPAAAEFIGEAESLLADATTLGVDAFAKSCRDMARSIRSRRDAQADVNELERQRAASKISRWVDRETGMHKTLIELDPISDRQFWSAVQRERGSLRSRTSTHDRSWDRLTVDGLLAAVAGSPVGPSGGSLIVHIDVGTLTDGPHADGSCELDNGDPVPIETMRRLACDAGIIPVVLNGAGVVLDQGRTRRLATAEQRTAIEAMQQTCSHPDCTVTIDDCRIHHIDPWRSGGRTDLARMAPLCEPHHHLVHEGGWRFDMSADRVATWTRPDGVVHWSGPLVDRRPRPVGAGR